MSNRTVRLNCVSANHYALELTQPPERVVSVKFHGAWRDIPADLKAAIAEGIPRRVQALLSQAETGNPARAPAGQQQPEPGSHD